ncbi:MAG TPA: hypothetical protein VIX86_01130 [Streptosporangiaceae bacterium]
MPDETWRPVPACRWFGVRAGVAEASSLARVRTVRRTLADGRGHGGQVLTATPDRDGYLRVKVAGRMTGVHVLVCLAFHGPPEVRHLNGLGDNTPASLAWGSRRDNEQDKKEGKVLRQSPLPVEPDLGR